MYPNDPRDPRTRAYEQPQQDPYGKSGHGGGDGYDNYRQDQYRADAYRPDPYHPDTYGSDNYRAGDRNDGYYDDRGYAAAAYQAPAARPSRQSARAPKPPRRGPQINAGLFAGGVLATAVVTALAAWLVAWIIRVISQRITETGKFGIWNPVAQDEYWFAVVGALCALLAGALWYVLQLTTPSPDQFFGWIVGLLIAAAVLLPLLLSQDWTSAVGTAIMHLVIGLPILFLIRAMGSKSLDY